VSETRERVPPLDDQRVVRRPEGRAQVVAALVDAAERLVTERGPARVTLRDVAATAEVNLGLVHRHIGSKDDLLQAVLERVARTDGLRLDRGTHGDGSLGWHDVARRVFAPSRGAFDDAHLLAWLLLDGLDPASLADRLPLGDALLPLARDRAEPVGDAVGDDAADDPGDDDTAARIAVLGLLTSALGWRLFGPVLVAALRLDGHDRAQLGERLAGMALGRTPSNRSRA
jgi:AcrR family transcriptional regulator